jgi:hypothetical protein
LCTDEPEICGASESLENSTSWADAVSRHLVLSHPSGWSPFHEHCHKHGHHVAMVIWFPYTVTLLPCNDSSHSTVHIHLLSNVFIGPGPGRCQATQFQVSPPTPEDLCNATVNTRQLTARRLIVHLRCTICPRTDCVESRWLVRLDNVPIIHISRVMFMHSNKVWRDSNTGSHHHLRREPQNSHSEIS